MGVFRSVDEKLTLKMVHFVLKDASEKTPGLDLYRLAIPLEAREEHLFRARDVAIGPFDAQAPFFEHHLGAVYRAQLRIEYRVELHSALGIRHLRHEHAVGEADLVRRKTNAVRALHREAHISDKFADLSSGQSIAANFERSVGLECERCCCRAEKLLVLLMICGEDCSVHSIYW